MARLHNHTRLPCLRQANHGQSQTKTELKAVERLLCHGTLQSPQYCKDVHNFLSSGRGRHACSRRKICKQLSCLQTLQPRATLARPHASVRVLLRQCMAEHKSRRGSDGAAIRGRGRHSAAWKHRAPSRKQVSPETSMGDLRARVNPQIYGPLKVLAMRGQKACGTCWGRKRLTRTGVLLSYCIMLADLHTTIGVLTPKHACKT